MRVLVCGTTFGQVYLEGLREAEDEFELAGILGRGSERSEACAAHYGVPSFSDLDELPGDIDIACVVVRSGLLGGQGVTLAQDLMKRGINVIQEHPLHHDELAGCLRTARSAGVVYRLNSFYPHVGPVRRFLAAADRLSVHGSPIYVDAACGFQLAYSLLDILGKALGGVRPWAFADPPPTAANGDRPGAIPFRSLEGVLGGVPLTLRVQNQMDPGDPDNHAHLDHRITLGTEAGNLTLVNTHGPIVFSQRPRYPHDPRDPDSRPHFDGHGPDRGEPSATVLGPPRAPGFTDIFDTLWPPAVRHALERMRDAILGRADAAREGQHHLSVCLVWQGIAARLGPPELLRLKAPAPLGAEQLRDVLSAGVGQ